MRSSSRLWSAVSSRSERIFRLVLLGIVAFYRSLGTAHLGGACRFTPSCSAYALEALHSHPSHKAFWLITKRVCNCRPGGGCGFDPVPPAGGF